MRSADGRRGVFACFFYSRQILSNVEKKENNGGLFRRLRFDEPEETFELLETERGEPPLFVSGGQREESGAPPETDERDGIGDSVSAVRARLQRELHTDVNTDVIVRPFALGGEIAALAIFMNGMADGEQINDFILRPGMRAGCMDGAGERLAAYALSHVFSMQEAELTRSWATLKRAVEEGRTAVCIEGDSAAVLMDTRGFASRSVEPPQNEVAVLGPHEAFNEKIRTNITLVRCIVRTDDLVCEMRPSGGMNGVNIAIMYRLGVANEALVERVRKKFASVKTLTVTASGTLQQLTDAHPRTPVPTMLTTERPDRAASMIMDGRVAVLCEGSPFAIVMPATLFMLMRGPMDTYLSAPLGTVVRVVRYIGAFLSIIMPAYFLALAQYHQGMLSGEILSTVIASRSMVFLPLGVEMLFLLLVFQLVREAGLGAPGALGQSVGIIGGLILGQAAVSANVVSKVALIIVALAGLGNFAVPDFSLQLAVVYYRMLLVVCAWIAGLLGITVALLVSAGYLASLKSYGVPFLAPVAPKTMRKGPSVARGTLQNCVRTSDSVNTEAGA